MTRNVVVSILVALGVSACASPASKPKPPIWTADYGVPFDIMAGCLAAQPGDAFTASSQISTKAGTATVSFLPRNAPQAESAYTVRRTGSGTSQVSWQRLGNVGGLDWLDIEARNRANRCGGA
jgi:hypothetical protein